ncbi:MAG: aldehyde ferredoxin oxidoreductase family protein [Spirochaetales bacterium]|nr:aldehyde ferredoxin oxidoreductase family protein [Spirochaetales bacterium]
MSGSMYDRIIRIDCSKNSSRVWEVPEDLKSYLGGMGYGTKLLVDEVDPTVDALSPDNKIILTVGPLTGTSAPLHAQSCIVTKSPLTGTILNCYAGGFIGAEIKYCGIDGVIFEGASSDWKIVLIDNDKVSFENADPVMGMGTEETENWIKNRYGVDYKTISIGRAGEKHVRMAALFSETRTYGRGGAGAVLGSKKIKAVAFRGTCGADLADVDEFTRLVKENMSVISDACGSEYSLVGMFSRFGTGAGMALVQSRGALATRNSQFGSFESSEAISGQNYEKDFYTRWVSCYGCPVHCGRIHKFSTHDGGQSWARGPEYETMYSLGSQLNNGDPDVLAEANRLTEVYGVDSLTIGVTISFAFECAEKGLLSDPDLKLEFGDPASILGLIRKIGEREGIGNILAEGPARAAKEIGGGSSDFAMQVKNSGFAAWMPRRMVGTGLAFATSNRGACHKRAPIGAEITGQVDMLSFVDKAQMVKKNQDVVNAIFTLISCRFHEFMTPHEFYPDYIKAASGISLDLDDFYALGERIWNLEKLFNLGAGFGRSDDILPARCYNDPIKGDSSESSVLDYGKWQDMLTEYYSLRGWDYNGIPQKAKLDALGIGNYFRG